MNTKFRFTTLLVALSCICSANAWDLNDLKGILGGNEGNGTAQAVTNILTGLFQKDKLSVKDIEGTWNYSAPAVTFKSDNLLQKAGGEAAASAIEKKLAPYYKTTGLTNLIITIAADSTFEIHVNRVILKGTIEAIDDDSSNHNFVFHFQALKKINLGSVNAYITKSVVGEMDLMFDVTKLVAIAEKVSSVSKSQAITSAVKLLKSYDGVCAGFKLKKDSSK